MLFAYSFASFRNFWYDNKNTTRNHSYKRGNGMGQFLFIILCVTLGYVAYKHAGDVRSDGSALCRKNCDECTRKCWIMKKTENQKWCACFKSCFRRKQKYLKSSSYEGFQVFLMGFYMECFLKGTLFWYGYVLWKIPLQNLKFSPVKDCFPVQLILYSN